MKHLNKVLAYFSSTYINSVRYNQSLYSWFRLVFERNVKYKSTVSNLGNVFKNSKWTDFKSQNIKEALIKDWFFIFIIFVSLFLSYCILLGLLRSDSIIRSVPFVNRLIEVITELWVPFIDYVDYLCVCLGSYYVFLMFKFREFFFNYNYDLINNTLVQKNSQSNSKPSMLDNNSSLLETTSTKQSKSLSTASSTCILTTSP